MRYMCFHDGSQGMGEETDRESNRLLTKMREALRELYAHQLDTHAKLNYAADSRL